MLRIGGDHHHSALVFIDRHPRLAFHELALELSQHGDGLDPLGVKRLIRQSEKLRQANAQRRIRDLELIGQHLLKVRIFSARKTHCKIELGSGDHPVYDQIVVFGLRADVLRPALLEGGGQGFAKRYDPMFSGRRERLS